MAYKNLISNQSGFSLAEIMVASGLLSLLAVATVKISDINLKSLKRSEASLETQSITTAISQNLLNGESCLNTLSPLGALANGMGITEIRNRVDSVIFNTSDTYGGNTLKIKGMKVEDLSISPSSIPSGQSGYGELNLVLELERVSSQISKSSKVIEKKIPLRVEVDSGKNVTKCYAATENAIDTAKIAACNSIGGVFNSATDNCDLSEYPQSPQSNIAVSTEYLQDFQVVLDDKYVDVAGDTMTGQLTVENTVQANQFCVDGRCRDFKATACGPGQMVESIKADGTLVCKGIKCAPNKYFEGFDTNGNMICKALPTGSCDTDSYVSEVKLNGEVICSPLPAHWSVSCAEDEYLQSISSTGEPNCKKIHRAIASKSCQLGEGVRGFNADGELICSSNSSGGILERFEKTTTALTTSHTFTLDQPGTLIATANTKSLSYSGYNNPSGAYNGVFVNGAECASDFVYEYYGGGMTYTNSSTCIRLLAAGTWTVLGGTWGYEITSILSNSLSLVVVSP